MTKFATFTAASVVALFAGVASAADYDTDINGNLTQVAVAIDANNIAIGEDAEAIQATNCIAGTRVNGNATQVAVVIDGNNVAIGNGSRAVQGSNLAGSNC